MIQIIELDSGARRISPIMELNAGLGHGGSIIIAIGIPPEADFILFTQLFGGFENLDCRHL